VATKEEMLKIERMYNALLKNGFTEEMATELTPILAYESREKVDGVETIFVQGAEDPESPSFGLVQANLSSMGPAIYRTMVDVGYDLPPMTKEQEMQMSHNRPGKKDERQFKDRKYIETFLKSLDIEQAAILVKHLFWQKRNEGQSEQEALEDLYETTVKKFSGEITTDPTALDTKNDVDGELLIIKDKLDSDDWILDSITYFDEVNQREYESQVPKEAGNYQDARFETEMKRPNREPIKEIPQYQERNISTGRAVEDVSSNRVPNVDAINVEQLEIEKIFRKVFGEISQALSGLNQNVADSTIPVRKKIKQLKENKWYLKEYK